MKKWFGILLIVGTFLILSCGGGNEKNKIFTGVIEGTVVEIPALTGGQILGIYIDTGDTVLSGQTIAQIDTTELSYQRQQVQGGLAEIAVQENIAQTNLNRASNDLQYVRQKYQRFEELLKKQSVPQQTVDDLKNQLQNAQSAYQTSRQQVQNIEAKKEQLQAQLKSIQKKIDDATITSPISGTISEKYYEDGEAIPTFNPIAEVIDLKEVWVKIYMSETMLPNIKVGQEVKIIPDGTKKTLAGKVSWISPKAEFTPKTILTPETRTSLVYAIKITIPNPEKILKQGMPVEIQI
ncbi:MAG: efflux RND transporter periplasmic adaptor subunit [Calditrichia bacterium]